MKIKHDGFRIMALRSEDRVRLFTRNGYDFAARFPRIVAAVKSLPVRSCLIDGEAIVVDADGLSVFDLLRHRHHDDAAILWAACNANLDAGLPSEPARGCMAQRGYTLVRRDQAEDVRAAYAAGAQHSAPTR
jgi:hypothetical protein